MAQEVFKAAGDPNVFPDQIKAGLLPWTPLKVYARVPSFSISPKGMYDYATGKWAPVRFYDYVAGKWIDAVPSTTLTLNEGTYDPALGSSYIQLATRGPGSAKIPERRHRHPALRRLQCPLSSLRIARSHRRQGALFLRRNRHLARWNRLPRLRASTLF